MQTRLFGLTNGQDTLLGRFLLHAGAVVCEPADSALLQEIHQEVLFDPVHQDKVAVEDDPALWLRLLPLTYRSGYLRADFSEEDAAA